MDAQVMKFLVLAACLQIALSLSVADANAQQAAPQEKSPPTEEYVLVPAKLWSDAIDLIELRRRVIQQQRDHLSKKMQCS
jgi:hypothetical protein